VEEVRNTDLRVYPNPSSGLFTVRSNVAGEYQLLNAVGQVVDAFSLGGHQPMSKDVQVLSAGVYFIRNVEDGTVERVVVSE
jgi:hypothetical protein